MNPFSPLVTYGLLAAMAVTFVTGTYVKGRFDGKAAYQAKLERAINKAIVKGEGARAEALKKFDAQKDIEDDGFARD